MSVAAPGVFADRCDLQATPDEDWRFDHWEGALAGAGNPGNLLMDSDKTVTAVFIETFTLNTTVSGNGSVTPSGGTFDSGTEVSLTAAPGVNWRFDHWAGDLSGMASSGTVTMDADKSVTAVFVPITYTLSATVNGGGNVSPSGGSYNAGSVQVLTAYPDSGWQFSHWTGALSGTVNPAPLTMDGNKSVTAVFTQITYTLTTSVQGTGTVSPSGGTYNWGAQVTLQANPGAGYVFLHWTGSVSGSQNPVTFTMNSNKSVTAVFVPTYTLTVAITGSGTVTPSGGTYESGTALSLTAEAAPGWRFDHWEGDLLNSPNPASLTMDSNKSVRAVFIQTFTLTATAQGGGSVTPAGGVYDAGSTVVLTANPQTGWQFDHWEGSLSGSTNPATVVMNGNKTVTAVFDPITYTLTTGVLGEGSVFPALGTHTYNQGEIVTLSAFPAPGWRFDHWAGALDGDLNPALLSMNADKGVTAVFEHITFVLVTDVTGEGSVSPPTGLYSALESVTLAAMPQIGWMFSHWSGDLSGSTNPDSLTMTSDKAVTANFVTIAKLQYDNGNGYVDVPSPLYVKKGDSVTFKAIIGPEGASWPSGKPVWGGTAGASGTGETKSLTFDSVSTSIGDYKSVTAECGATQVANVVVVDVEFKSIQFLSDHGTLRSSGSWTGPGTLFPEPECTLENSYPISHTKGTCISLAYTLKVTPALTGFSPSSAVRSHF